MNEDCYVIIYLQILFLICSEINLLINKIKL
jgi:hypothetical protein